MFFFIPNKLDLTFPVPIYCAKFHQNRIKIAAVGVFTDRLQGAAKKVDP